MSLIRKVLNQWNKIPEMRTTAKERLETCKKCKFYKRTTGTCGTMFPWTDTVKYYGKEYELCGCPMKTKTAYPFATCPVGKWGAYEGFSEEHLQEVKEAVEAYEKRETKDNLINLYTVYKKILGSAGHHINPNDTGCGRCRNNRLDELRMYIKRMEKC